MQISFDTISIKIFNKQNYSTSFLNHTVKLNIFSQICNLFKPYQQLFTMLSTSTKQPQKNTSVHHDVQRQPSKYLLSYPVTHIIDAFVETNNFPSSWKCAQMKKVPTPVEKSDFRRIAIPLVCSQVIEFIENTQL